MNTCSSAYVHIPFCVRKCPYCDFTSFEKMSDHKGPYLRALFREVELTSVQSPGGPLSTVYFGGGTPSLLTPEEGGSILGKIGDSFGIESSAEITIEANPGTVTASSLRGYRNAGFNRISIGVQSFSNRVLRGLGRIHTAEEADRAVRMSAEEGFSNISCDLMLGVPEQTLTDIVHSVRHLIDLSVPHISCYSLSLEDGTLFFEKYSGRPDQLPSDEEEREMYHTVRRLLADAGYRHYEISNFALTGFESRHNTVYWDALPYYGFGCGAHSYIDGARIGNTVSLKRYIEVLTADTTDLKGIQSETERIDREAEMREVMLLGFRKLSGISTADFQTRFGIDPEQIFGHELEALLQGGRIEKADGRWFLSEKGLDFGNDVFRSFVQ